MKELQAVNQNVILDASSSVQKQTASGIIIPDTAKEKPQLAKVVSMSFIDDAEIQIGDLVLFSPFSGKEIEFEGNKYLIIQYSEILAKVIETDEI